MAEATSSTSSSSTSSPSSTPSHKQYIKASANDEGLEPDALRGNENIVKELGIVNDDDARAKRDKKDA